MTKYNAIKAFLKNKDGEWISPYTADTLKKTQITNCLLEIPQRIKLEFNDGVLTLKAGSEVIVPNGFEADGVTPKFDYVTVESDVSLPSNSNFVTSTVFVFFRYTSNTLIFCDPLTQAFSGTTQPTSTVVRYWLDTNTNLMRVTVDSGQNWSIGETSLPLCILNVDSSNDTITSIDQVFNGFGYIGSTIWVDKGVKGLIPNGRNEDGSLKNVEYTNEKLCIETLSVTWSANRMLFLSPNYNIGIFRQDVKCYYEQEEEPPIDSSSNTLWYKPSENIFRYSSNKSSWNCVNMPTCYLGDFYVTTGIITSFNPKQTFRAIDYSDKSEVSGWTMPSSKYIDLTLGATNSRYVAPANGWFYVAKKTGISTHTYLDLANETSSLAMRSNSYGSTTTVSAIYIPAKKGDTVRCSYNLTGETTGFRFIFAQGEV